MLLNLKINIHQYHFVKYRDCINIYYLDFTNLYKLRHFENRTCKLYFNMLNLAPHTSFIFQKYCGSRDINQLEKNYKTNTESKSASVGLYFSSLKKTHTKKKKPLK